MTGKSVSKNREQSSKAENQSSERKKWLEKVLRIVVNGCYDLRPRFFELLSLNTDNSEETLISNTYTHRQNRQITSTFYQLCTQKCNVFRFYDNNTSLTHFALNQHTQAKDKSSRKELDNKKCNNNHWWIIWVLWYFKLFSAPLTWWLRLG